jgi:hypothetical protein
VVNQNAFVGPAPNSTGVDANSIVLLVAGIEGQSDPGNFPKSVTLEENVTLHGYVLAPNGLVNLRQNVNVTGAVVGKWVLVEQNSKLTRPSDPPIPVSSAGHSKEPAVADTPLAAAPVDNEVAITATEEALTEGTLTEGALTEALRLPLVASSRQATAISEDNSQVGSAPLPAAEQAEPAPESIVIFFPSLMKTSVLTTTPIVTTTPAVTTTPTITSTPVLTPTSAVTTPIISERPIFLPIVSR